MTVKELINALMDCRSDADVVSSLFDNGTNFSAVKGLHNGGNFVVLYEQIAYDSERAKEQRKKP